MFFSRIKTPGIAHNAYILGDQGEAVVVDPRRDIEEYLSVARENKLAIKYVIETHRQEDFVLGSAELARVTGAKIVNGRHKLFGHGDIRLEDGERIELAGLKFLALHTPGHTPESMSYAVFIKDAPEAAWGVFSGDALFFGEAGRTDLPDPDKTAENAGILYDSIKSKILPLGDQAHLFPAHGAGSVCGGHIADRDDSTLGIERRYNPAFTKSRDEFIKGKLEERIPRPPYFKHMEEVNLNGGIPLAMRPSAVKLLSPKQLHTEMPQGIVIDARSPEAFAGAHIPKSHSVWLAGLPVFGGWIASKDSRVFLVLNSMDQIDTAVLSLARIGIDGIEGVLAGGFEAWRDAGLPLEKSGTLAPKEVAKKKSEYVTLDVREVSEFEEEGHIPGARHMYVGYLDERVDEALSGVKKDAPIAVTCSVGHRASLAVSILERHGYPCVANLLGGMTAWEKLGLPLEKGAERRSKKAA